MVRVLASHQCVPGSIPGPGVICGLSLLFVLLRRFFSGFSGFSPSAKTNISKFQFDWEFEGHEFIGLSDCRVSPSLNKVDLISFDGTHLEN